MQDICYVQMTDNETFPTICGHRANLLKNNSDYFPDVLNYFQIEGELFEIDGCTSQTRCDIRASWMLASGE